MNIRLTKQSLAQAPQTHTRAAWSEKEHSYLEQKGKTATLYIGAEKYAEVNERKFRTLCRALVRFARTHKIDRIAIDTKVPFPCLKDKSEEWVVGTMVENFLLAQYEYAVYKKETYALKEILICGTRLTARSGAIARALTLTECVNAARDLANTPGGVMTPALLAKRAQELARGSGVRVMIFDKTRIEKEKMGALLGVARGSRHGPRFIILEYWGAGKVRPSSEPTGHARGARGADKHDNSVVFVGKGITFDSGGLNVKVGDGMLDMHLDMSGGAAVIAAVVAAGKLGLKKNIIGLIPAAENAISDESIRPGDVLVGRSGKTIDVLNTDAEGRLILSDALTYAKEYQPRVVIDVATLTGAAVIALGEHASALMTKDDMLRERLMALAEESGDYLWPLPLWDEYQQYTKGRFGDVSNVPISGTRYGGAINGGMFLSHFADYPKGCAWAHIDMAPRMTSVSSDKLAKGATGEPVRLLVAIAEQY